jgi:hypothetical protein
MGQILHGSARTSAVRRRALQWSQESLAKLPEGYHLNPKTVAKRKKQTHVHDTPLGRYLYPRIRLNISRTPKAR